MNQRCHFHPQNSITNFCCSKQCTLPLCFVCQQIHLKQHEDKFTSANIIKYNQAWRTAIDDIELYHKDINQNITDILKKLANDRQVVLKMFDDCQKEMNKNQQILSQIAQKLNKLKKGSIKTLIYYYSGDIKLSFPYLQYLPLSSQLVKFNLKPLLKAKQNNNFHKDHQIQKKYDYFDQQIKNRNKQNNGQDIHNVFNKIDQNRFTDRHRERTRKSIFDDTKKAQSKQKLQKYHVQYKPEVVSSVQLPAPSPKFNYENTINIIDKKIPIQNDPHLIFQNKYKISYPSGSQQYQAYTKNRQIKQNQKYNLHQYVETRPTISSQRLRSASQTVLSNAQKINSQQNKQPLKIDLKKQVMSPEQIRRMLQRRMQERNRNILQIKQGKNEQKINQIRTKQSIINQIYQ